MTSPPLYFRISQAIDPILAIGSMSYYDSVETPYAHEEPLPKEDEHSRNTGIQNQVKGP
jgi:hypothetical protein